MGDHWEEAAGGMDDPVQCLTVAGGQLWAGGYFGTAGGVHAPWLARWKECPCPADVDGDGAYTTGLYRDGSVDINDLLTFLDAFAAGDVRVDLDDDGDPAVGTPDGATDVNDLLFFLAHFESGC